MPQNMVTKPFGLLLIATAHVLFNGPGQAEVTGIVGSNITLQFRFNDSVIDNKSHFAIHVTGHRKIAEYSKSKGCIGGGIFDIYRNTSVLFHITKLKPSHSGIYWASLFVGPGRLEKSDKVQLIVRAENRSSTVSPLPTNITIIEDRGFSSFFSFRIVTVLVVLPLLLLATVLPLLAWCLMRSTDKQQQSSISTIQQQPGEGSNSVSPPSLIYSVLNFPQRSSAVLDISPNGTEYAAVSYLPDHRQM